MRQCLQHCAPQENSWNFRQKQSAHHCRWNLWQLCFPWTGRFVKIIFLTLCIKILSADILYIINTYVYIIFYFSLCRSMFPLPRSLPQFLSFPVEASQSDTWSQAGDWAGLSSMTGVMSLSKERSELASNLWPSACLDPTTWWLVLWRPS